jgi:hypothetical protein
VLVKRVDGDAIGGRSRRGGQALAKGIVTFVSDADPIDRTQDNGITAAKQNNTSAPQSQFFDPLDRVISHHEPDWRRRVDVKGRQLQARLGRVVGGGCYGKTPSKPQDRGE